MKQLCLPAIHACLLEGGVLTIHVNSDTPDRHPACLAELKRLWSCADLAHARDELDRWVRLWGEARGCEKLVTWVEEHIEETFSAYRLPPAHRTRMKSTNMLERYNEEIRRHTRVIRIFPNEPACLRLIRALAVETHDQWVSGKRYLSGWTGLEKDPVQPTMKLRKAA